MEYGANVYMENKDFNNAGIVTDEANAFGESNVLAKIQFHIVTGE